MGQEYLIGVKKRLAEYVLLLVVLFLMELIFNLIIFKSVTSYLLLEVTFILILTIPMLVFKHNFVANIYGSIIFVLFSTFFIVNLEMYAASSDIFTFKYLTLAGEAAAVMSIDFINFWYILILVVFIGIYLSALIVINKLFKGGEYNQRRGITVLILSLLILIPLRMVTYEVIESDYSNTSLYYKESGQEIVIKSTAVIKRAALKNFGLFNYTLADIEAQMCDISTFGEEIEDEKEYTSKTQVTGVCKDYNVLEIMIETGTSILIDENLTPNLYKLRSEGINFTNNYSKNKTNISEFIGIAGSVTSTIKNLDTQAPQSLPSVLGGLFGYDTNYFHCNYATFYNRGVIMPNVGFDNSYFVGSDKDGKKIGYYGSSVKYYPTDSEFIWKNIYNGRYPYDSNYFTAVKDLMIPVSDTPFYSFWTTLSMHGPYNCKNAINEYYSTQYETIKEYMNQGLYTNPCSDDSETVQLQFLEYQCKAMVFDEALGLALADLEEKGVLDNTLIVLYGDHEPYYKVGLDKDLKYYIYNSDSEYYSPEYETFITFYNKNLTTTLKDNINEFMGFSLDSNDSIIYSGFTSPYIIVPTILDLLGIRYTKGNYVGRSIFQSQETTNLLDNIFYSTELGILFSNDISSDGEYSYWHNDNISDLYCNEFYESVYKVLGRIAKFDSNYLNGKYNIDVTIKEIFDSYSYFE